MTTQHRGMWPGLGAATATIAVAFAASPAAAKTGTNAVKTIETNRTESAREIVIHTSGAPTFSVFRLSEPFRVLIDVSHAEMPDAIDAIDFADDPVLSRVSASALNDGSSSVVRIEIALDARHAYDVKAVGTTIVARIDAPGDEAVAPSSTVELGRLESTLDGHTVMLTADLGVTTPSPDAVSIMELDDPPRVVIDLAGAAASPSFQRLDVSKLGVHRARLATNDDGVRIVIDLTAGRPLPAVEVGAAQGKLQISIAREVETPAAEPAVEKIDAVEKPETKVETAAAPVAPAPAPAKMAAKPSIEKKAGVVPAKVTDVRFESKNGFVRLTIDLDADRAVAKDSASTRGQPRLRVLNAKLPETLIRTLDTTAVAGKTIQSISTYNDGEDTIIAANLTGDVEHRHWRKGNRLIWDFRDKTAAATTPDVTTAAATTPERDRKARVLSYPEQATSGFESTATTISGALSTARQRYRGRRISLDLKDADVQNVLRLLADVAKLNIVAADDVTGKITMKLRNVPWDQALDVILQSKKLDKTRNGNIIRVAPLAVLEAEEQLRLQRRDAQEKLEQLSVRLIPVNYAEAKSIANQIKGLLSPRGKVSTDERTNVLVIEDIPEILLKSERLIRTLDTQTPQVLIEARIVEAATSFARDLGIQWGGNALFTPAFGTQTGLAFPNTVAIRGGAEGGQTPTDGVLQNGNGFAINLPAAAGTGAGGAIGFVFGSAGGSDLLSLRLSAAETQGKSKIISAPKIVTLDNKTARIQSGEQIPITVVTANGPTTRFVSAQLQLEVTPHVTANGSISMVLNATKNELSNRQDVFGTPGIITRQAQTEMLIRDGDTAVMGGIYKRTSTDNAAYVPWIGQIPVLGWLFKKTNRSDSREELLIFISPRIVNRNQSIVTGG